MKYLLAIPVVILLAAAVYIFFVYDPNPSKQSNNNGAPITRDEPQQTNSPDIGNATVVTDVEEIKIAPATIPSAEETSAQPSYEESQAEVAAPGEESSSEIAISEEAESSESFVSAADGNSTEEATAETAEATIAETTEETTTSIAIDASTQEPVTSTAVDESLEETSTLAAAEEFIEESSPEDATAKRVTYVETGSAADSPQDASFGEDYSREPAAQVEVKQSQSIVADEQQPFSGGYTEYKAVISSSLSQAASDAGMSANQSARIGMIFKPYLDSSRELRKGDELTIFLDPGAAKTGNDANQIHRLEFHGVRKNLVATRKEDSLNEYEVRDADGKMLRSGVSNTSIVVAPPQREVSVEPALAVEKQHRREVSVEPAPAVEKSRREMSVESVPAVERSQREVAPVETSQRSAADYNAATGEMKRLESVVSITLFSAAREAGLNAGQLKKLEEIMNPYIDFNKDVRKGDRIAITLDGGDIYSSEYNGVVKKLTVARGDDGAYREVKPGEAGSFSGEGSESPGDENSGKKPPFWKRWWRSFGSSTEGRQ